MAEGSIFDKENAPFVVILIAKTNEKNLYKTYKDAKCETNISK